MNPNLVIILIHGTFAKNAPWVKPSSLLSKTLADRIHTPLQIKRFEWTGANNFAARDQATERLREMMRDVKRANPNVRFVLIAHSHGGNVALRAAADPNLSGVVAGVLTLSTPFLWVRQRFKQRLHEFLTSLTILLLMLLSLSAGGVILYFGTSLGIEQGYLKYACAATLLATAVILGFVFFRAEKRLGRIISQSAFDASLNNRTFIMRTTADEASLVLALATLINWVPSALLNVCDSWSDGFFDNVGKFFEPFLPDPSRLSRSGLPKKQEGQGRSTTTETHPQAKLAWAIGCLLWGLRFVLAILGLGFAIGGMMVTGVLTVGLLALISLFLIILSPLLGVLNALAFGREVILLSLFAEVSAEATPPGVWSVQTFVPPDHPHDPYPRDSGSLGHNYPPPPEEIKGWGLKHSAPYQDPEIIQHVIAWIQLRLKDRHEAAPSPGRLDV